MLILVYQDHTITLDLETICRNLGRLAPTFSFLPGKETFTISTQSVQLPRTFDRLPAALRREAAECYGAVLATRVLYDTNLFYDSKGRFSIVSFDKWERYTKLPISNGLVYFLVCFLADLMDLGSTHERDIGCINDYLGDKRNVDMDLRAAFVCSTCRETFTKKPATMKEKRALAGILAILNDLSAASRSDQDILDFWAQGETASSFDVFLCHNSKDKPEVRKIARRLKDEGIRVWLDEEQLPPGTDWVDALDKQIKDIGTAAVFVGPNGIGPWEDNEIKAFLRAFVSRGCRVIPVILRGTRDVPDLPVFLSGMQWVDFRKKNPNPMKNLLWGITAKRSMQTRRPRR